MRSQEGAAEDRADSRTGAQAAGCPSCVTPPLRAPSFWPFLYTSGTERIHAAAQAQNMGAPSLGVTGAGTGTCHLCPSSLTSLVSTAQP